MTDVISVKFRGSNKLYYFDPAGMDIKAGDGVIVETARGTEFGDVSVGVHEVPDEQVIQPLKAVSRIASANDREMRDTYRAREKEAYTTCMQKILSHNLDMKLVDAEYTFNGSKIVFYFTADGRVDFRELVKDLASVFKTRIELRQIGVRDEAKLLGGLGSCGRPVCCREFLPDFQPVSIKMAKEQNLSLSPTKISGICGRLMCCLKYEQSCYETTRRQMPRLGKEVTTPEGMTGTAVENNVITEKTRVKLMLPDGTIDIREYPYHDLGYKGAPRKEAEAPAEVSEAPEAIHDEVLIPDDVELPEEEREELITEVKAELEESMLEDVEIDPENV